MDSIYCNTTKKRVMHTVKYSVFDLSSKTYVVKESSTLVDFLVLFLVQDFEGKAYLYLMGPQKSVNYSQNQI